ncbi:MAG: hypothetical protein LBV04_01065 [Deferribacteraceae bacterium]|nr:hypothetical protein [Deferribacteraceae bacterium]
MQQQSRAQQSDCRMDVAAIADKMMDYILKAPRWGLGLSADEPRSGD